MNASKENCQHAIDLLDDDQFFIKEPNYTNIREFLEAALKKLPSEASFAKDKKRKTAKGDK